MDLKEVFKQRIQKIEMLSDFVALYCEKKESLDDLRQLDSNVHTIRKMLLDVAQLLNDFSSNNRKVYKELMEQMQMQQLMLLESLDKQLESELMPQKNVVDKFTKPMTTTAITADDPSSGCEAVLKEISNNVQMTPNRYRPNEPAHMSLADYVKSPFTLKRMKPVALHFYDFERVISSDEFVAVPSYAFAHIITFFYMF